MTGPEHYRQAEKILAGMSGVKHGAPAETGMLLEAIGHGLLALAAAAGLNDAECGMRPVDWREWIAAAGKGSVPPDGKS